MKKKTTKKATPKDPGYKVNPIIRDTLRAMDLGPMGHKLPPPPPKKSK